LMLESFMATKARLVATGEGNFWALRIRASYVMRSKRSKKSGLASRTPHTAASTTKATKSGPILRRLALTPANKKQKPEQLKAALVFEANNY
jgi:hypothetical protein